MPRGHDDTVWMRAALGLARRSLGQVWPNPAVGAIIVSGDRVLGRGVTAPGGRPHAETVAIRQATIRYGAEALRGATTYVTLEPCAHHGLTPPCTAALIEAGIARVVCPLEDPDPRVSGRGLRQLTEASVAVTTGVLEREARALNAGFLKRLEDGRPLVTLKLATSLDGRIATSGGESRWITGAMARRRVHAMRADHDGILIGAGTARADNPMLDVRTPGLTGRKPVRIVADTKLSLDPGSHLARTAADHPLWLLHGSETTAPAAALKEKGARLIRVPVARDGHLDMAAGLRILGEYGLTRLLAEGGGRMAASLTTERLADRMCVFSAGRAIGADGVPGLGAFGLQALADAPRFELDRIERCGPDTLSHWSAAT